MKNKQINSILTVDKYLTLCKHDKEKSDKIRSYLNLKIKKALENNLTPSKKSSLLDLIFVVL
jgi:hypothetical protein